MRRSTKIGWGLVGMSVIVAAWIFGSTTLNAFQDADLSVEYTDATCTTLDGTSYGGSATTIGLNSELTAIPANYFANTAITGVSINGSTSIGDSAFSNCTSLVNVALGDCPSIGSNAFANCRALTTISVSDTNTSYSVVGGCLYDKAGTTLIYVPYGLGETLSIPSGVTTIADDALADSNIKTIYVPSTVSTIGTQGNWGTDPSYDVSVSTDSVNDFAYSRFMDFTEIGGLHFTVSATGGSGNGEGNNPPVVDPVPTTHNVVIKDVYQDNSGVTVATDTRTTDAKADGTYTYSALDSSTMRQGYVCYGVQIGLNFTQATSIDVTVNGNDVEVQFLYIAVSETPATPSIDKSKVPFKYNETYHWKEAAGYKDWDNGPHTWGAWETVEPATATTGEKQKHKCTVCGYEQTRIVTKYTVGSDGSVTASGNKKPGTGGSYTTPKTADGFDSRYLLSVAILLGGVGVILFSRQKKLSIITERINNK